jgi:hypothetical protein
LRTGFDEVATALRVKGEVTVEFATGEQMVTVRSVVLGVQAASAEVLSRTNEKTMKTPAAERRDIITCAIEL